MSDLSREEIANTLKGLTRYVIREKYSGFDPYDALNSESLSKIPSKYGKIAVTQAFVYSPIDMRDLFKVKRGINPKTLGLALRSYCLLHDQKEFKKIPIQDEISKVVRLLKKCRAKGYSNYCWGFNFPWQDLTRYSEENVPTIVNTSLIGNAFLDLYESKQKKSDLDVAISASKFILEDLNIHESNRGLCFSYTPIDNNIVHNANIMGAGFLARVNQHLQDSDIDGLVRKATKFTLSYQMKDGKWPYSYNPMKKTERLQIDFHQGFILDAMCDLIATSKKKYPYQKALKRGAQYYMKEQFRPCGASNWRIPRKWPIDIHHQAQGIISMCRLYEIFGEKKYINRAMTISQWTLNNLLDERGFFHYQKWPVVTNKVQYIRWSQAWMMYGLSSLLSIGFTA